MTISNNESYLANNMTLMIDSNGSDSISRSDVLTVITTLDP